MQFFPPGRTYRFMRIAPYCAALSLACLLATIIALFEPGPKLGTDFAGGTELEVAFEQPVTTEEIRRAIADIGFSTPDVVKVEDGQYPDRYLIRVHEVSIIPEPVKHRIEAQLCLGDAVPANECPAARRASEVKVSPGGEKISLRTRETPDLAWIKSRLQAVSGIVLQPGPGNPKLQNARENKVEVSLLGTADKIMSGLSSELGEAKVPAAALRAEWIGPKAGTELRNAAIKSVVISLILIMGYVAFRFDVRFAPGAVLCLLHDALITLGALMFLGKELNLVTVAALLTIIGFSVNDTVVVYDRVRENLSRLRGATFPQLIDVSISEMLGRTILTSGTAIISLVAFFVWGTGTLRDFALTLIIGMVSGVYSTVYIALPLTHWLDRALFSKARVRARNPDRAVRRAA